MIGKHLCWSLFLTKMQAPLAFNFIRKRLRDKCSDISKLFKNTFLLRNTCGACTSKYTKNLTFGTSLCNIAGCKSPTSIKICSVRELYIESSKVLKVNIFKVTEKGIFPLTLKWNINNISLNSPCLVLV